MTGRSEQIRQATGVAGLARALSPERCESRLPDGRRGVAVGAGKPAERTSRH